ncbi:hypothetical protein Pfo_005137 [Paulownia fortunei]|nr:hypothetical protein Pfo_005137 [Paulownia fortunei]
MYGYRTTSSSSITFNPRVSKYYVTFAATTIETTVTDKAATATEWVQEITALYGGSPAVVGLDVEWRPHAIRSMSNKSATLQLCIDQKCLILQLFYMDEIPESVKGFLMDPNFTFVGIEVGDDVLKLKNEYGLDCSSYMDKPKHVCMSNWEARVLNEAQVEYACIDAFASYKIGHKLLIEK